MNANLGVTPPASPYAKGRIIDFPTGAGGIQRVVFQFAWRISILALPWQTRWFREAELAGWPWEQGNWAFYAAWIPMIAAVVSAGMKLRSETRDSKVEIRKMDKAFIWIAGGVVMISFVTSASYAASAQWILQAGLLAAFGWTLLKMRVKAESLAAWFILSLLPQAVLAYWQYAVQRVDAIRWLGIAFQSPKQLGVSVVEFLDLRYLRAYGGMPHPNILGGWLALGIFMGWQRAWKAAHKYEAFVWSAASAILGGAIVLTYSRSAFLALAAGIAATSIAIFVKRRDEKSSKQFGIFAIAVTLVFAGILAFTQRDVLLARADAGNRLTEQSGSARRQSLVDGWEVFKSRPFQGSGPNAELARLAQLRKGFEDKKTRQPLESPHNVFFLLIVDFGILGAGVFLWIIWRSGKALARSWWILPPLIVLAFFDHYLWSYWSGMVLTAVVFMTLMLPNGEVD